MPEELSESAVHSGNPHARCLCYLSVTHAIFAHVNHDALAQWGSEPVKKTLWGV